MGEAVSFRDNFLAAFEDPLSVDFYNGRRREVVFPAWVVVGVEDETVAVALELLDGVECGGEVCDDGFSADVMDPLLWSLVDDEISARVISECDEKRVTDIVAVIVRIGAIVLIDGDGGVGDVYVFVCEVEKKFVEVGSGPAIARVVWGQTAFPDDAPGETPSIACSFSVVVESDGPPLQFGHKKSKVLFGDFHIPCERKIITHRIY